MFRGATEKKKKKNQKDGFLGASSALTVENMKFGLPLAKKLLLELGVIVEVSKTDVGIQKVIHGSGMTLVISNVEMNNIMKIVTSLEDSNILVNSFTKTIDNEVKQQRGGFLSMLLSTLDASLLGRNNKCTDRERCN